MAWPSKTGTKQDFATYDQNKVIRTIFMDSGKINKHKPGSQELLHTDEEQLESNPF